MYAVIETGGKQYRVSKGDVLNIEKLGVEDGKAVEFDKVLVLNDDKETKFGTPYIEGAKVLAKVKESGKGSKIIVFKYKNKKDYRRKQGHRQPFTTVEITALTGTGAAPVKEKKAVQPKADAKTEKVAAAKVAKTEEKKSAKADKQAKEKKAEKPKASKPVKVSSAMKKDELIAYAKDNGIEIDEKATKAVIIETIEKAEKK